MAETKAIIVDLSAMPCSVIIIGVGSADFTNMRALDSDGKPMISHHGKQAVRDIVQFVEYTKVIAKGDLAEQVLMELPN